MVPEVFRRDAHQSEVFRRDTDQTAAFRRDVHQTAAGAGSTAVRRTGSWRAMPKPV